MTGKCVNALKRKPGKQQTTMSFQFSEEQWVEKSPRRMKFPLGKEEVVETAMMSTIFPGV